MRPFQDRVRDRDILAYAEGRLDPARKRLVEDYIAEHPEARERIEAYRRQDLAVRQAYGDVAEEPIPPRLLSSITARPANGIGQAAYAALVALLIVAAGASGWLARESAADYLAYDDFVDGVAAKAALAPTQRNRASAAPVPHRPMTWGANKFQLTLSPPDLRASGFAILSEEVVRIDDAYAIRLLYENDAGAELNLFVRTRWTHDRSEINLSAADNDKRVAYWADGPMVFALAGELETERLTELASQIDTELDIELLKPSLHIVRKE